MKLKCKGIIQLWNFWVERNLTKELFDGNLFMNFKLYFFTIAMQNKVIRKKGNSYHVKGHKVPVLTYLSSRGVERVRQCWVGIWTIHLQTPTHGDHYRLYIYCRSSYSQNRPNIIYPPKDRKTDCICSYF